MGVKPNINLVNALIRITFGFTVLAWSTAKLVRQPRRESYLLLAMCGAMKVAEGIVRFCPLTYFYETNLQKEPKSKPQEDADGSEALKDSFEGAFDENKPSK